MNDKLSETYDHAELYIKYYSPEIKKALFILGIAMAASYGARFGVSRAISRGTIRIKK